MLLHPWAAALEGATTTYPLPGPQFPSSDNLIGPRGRIPVLPAVGAHVRLIHCRGLPDLPILRPFPETPTPTTTDIGGALGSSGQPQQQTPNALPQELRRWPYTQQHQE